MRKLALDLESLQVDSFDTETPGTDVNGTVHGYDDTLPSEMGCTKTTCPSQNTCTGGRCC